MINRIAVFSLLIFFLFAYTTSLKAQQSDSGRKPPVLQNNTQTVRDDRPNSPQKNIGTSGDNSRVSPSLVTVPAVVTDRDGRYIANLRREDFKVYEDGVEQTLSYFASIEKPFTVALLLDVSGSTKYQLDQIRNAANTFISRLRMNDRMIAITFDGKISQLNEATDVRTLRQSNLHIPAITDGTVLYDAVDFAVKKMAGIPGRKAIVLMTDGVDQNSIASTFQSTLDEITEQDVMIYTVQYNTLAQLPQRLSFITKEKARRRVQERLLKEYARSEPYLRGLADKTGGRFYKAEDLRDVGPAFEAITAELGVQYSLGYYPKENTNGSSEHSIRVRVRFPNMVVRARDSYATGPTIAGSINRTRLQN